MRNHCLFMLILIIVIPFVAKAGYGFEIAGFSDGKISGLVQDASQKTTLEYANVVLYRSSDSSLVTGTITDVSGKFTIKNVPLGEYYMVVQFIGYKRKLITGISLSEKNKTFTTREIFLEPTVSQLNEVNITGEKPAVEYRLDKKVVNVAKNLNASGGTAVDALQNVPSVIVDVEGNVTIRGSSNYTVLVDGRPTAVQGNDLLRQTPASALETIEVITNPSAKYDPDGTAGIINLIMKKQNQNGLSGIINTSAGTGDKYAGDFTLNQRLGKINAYIGADAASRTYHMDQTIDRKNFPGDTTQLIYSATKRQVSNKGRSVKGGIDFFASEKNTVSLSGEWGYYGYERRFPNQFHVSSIPSAEETYYLNTNRFSIDGEYVSGSANLQHKFARKDHELSLNLFYSTFDPARAEKKYSYPTDPFFMQNGNENMRQNAYNDVDRNTARLKLNYALPIQEKYKLEAGFQGDMNTSDLRYRLDYFDYERSTWYSDTTYTHSFSFNQHLYAVYTTFSGQLMGNEYQAGLRYESMVREIDQVTPGRNFNIVFENWFPSLHISRPIGKGNQIQLSYSKRLNRPQEWMLNPYPMYSDEYFASYGNPYLKPDYTSALELNLMKTFKQSTASCEFFFRQTDQNINQVFTLDQEGKLISRFENIGSTCYAGFELNANLSLEKWMSLNVVGSWYYQQIDANTILQTPEKEFTEYNVQLIPRFIFPTGTMVQLVGYYYGPANFEQGRSAAFGQMDASVRQEFLKKKLSVSLRGSNLFGLAKNTYTIDGSGYYLKQTLRQEKNTLTLAVSYKINNYARPGKRSDSVELDSGGM